MTVPAGKGSAVAVDPAWTGLGGLPGGAGAGLAQCEVCGQDPGRGKFVLRLARGYLCERAREQQMETGRFSSMGEMRGG